MRVCACERVRVCACMSVRVRAHVHVTVCLCVWAHDCVCVCAREPVFHAVLSHVYIHVTTLQSGDTEDFHPAY